MMVFLTSLLHFFVDAICILALLSKFLPDSENIVLTLLIYNFCAFAMQMPIGLFVDLLSTKLLVKASESETEKVAFLPYVFERWFHPSLTVIGVLLTVIGSVVHPALLGIGNALFHIGAGVEITEIDYNKRKKGLLVGVFVAPGAIGLYAGKICASLTSYYRSYIWLYACLAMLLLGGIVLYKGICNAGKNAVIAANHSEFVYLDSQGKAADSNWSTLYGDGGLPKDFGSILFILALSVAVFIRSVISLGLSRNFNPAIVLISVICVALGKALGGFLRLKIGTVNTVMITMPAAACCFLFSDHPIVFCISLFLFNITMPITLSMFCENFPMLRGFGFGLLTFALFIGFVVVMLLPAAFITKEFASLGCALTFASLLFAARYERGV